MRSTMNFALESDMDKARQLVQALCSQMGARLIETHISWVLLDGAHAWKIKKPVQLPFLDARQLATRRRLCTEELRLNRRLAPQLYLDVWAISGTPAAPVLGDASAPIEYALRMRQFDDGALFTAQLQQGLLSPRHMGLLAQRLWRFHAAAEVAPAGSPWGSSQAVAGALQGVLAGLHAQSADADLQDLAPWLAQQVQDLSPLWASRQAQGHVVEGHGDLHLANLVVLGEEVTAFDCIEFDPALRWGDVIHDIAFVTMDLMAHGRTDLGWHFLNAYLDLSGQHAGLPLLRCALVYRALVRALVARIRGHQQGQAPESPPAHWPDHMALAHQLAQAGRPRLLITHGVSGSGKSHVSEGLMAQAPAVRLRSDVERLRLPGAPGSVGYTAQAVRATYARLGELARTALQAGWPVIVDATFLNAAEREAFRHLAQRLGVPFAILHCQAPLPILQARVAARLAQGLDASQADLDVLQGQWAQARALRPDERAHTLHVDTHAPVDVVALCQQWEALS